MTFGCWLLLTVLGIGFNATGRIWAAELRPARDELPSRCDLDDYRSVAEYLLMAEPDARPYYRFLTLSPLGQRAATAQDRAVIHAAVAHVLNSLSWQPQPVRPALVPDTQGRLMVFDLRELGWTDSRHWLTVVNSYPYGLRFTQAADTALRQAAADVQALSSAELPILRADWFVFAASQAPLYASLLELPRHWRDMEQRLGFASETNLATGQAVRAGFTRSGMSPQNRVVERHESTFGAVWVGYEFLPRRGKGDVLRFPLGPRFADNPFNRHAFQADGRSMSFQLPNGLFAYYLADSHGARVDQVTSTELIFDRRASAGTPAMVNGLSCINCHRQGVQGGFRDEVGGAGVLSGDGLEHLQQLYRPADQMQLLVMRDQQVYRAALTYIVAPYLDGPSPAPSKSAAPDQPLEQTATAEPIGRVVANYLRDLGPEEVAQELGLPDAETLRQRIQQQPALRQMGLGTLLQEPGGRLTRQRWEAIDGTSLFQDVAMELRLGTPILPGTARPSPGVEP